MAFPVFMTVEAARRVQEEDEQIQFAVHPALLPALVEWLNGRGLELVKLPEGIIDSAVPIYLAGLRDDPEE